MDSIVEIIVPVFGLITLGYAIAWVRVLPENTADVLSDFVFTLAIPFMIFRILVKADFSGTSPWPLWLSYFPAVAVVWTAGTWILRRWFHRDARAGVVAGFSCGFSNIGLIGIPLLYAAYGEQGVLAIFLIISIHLPTMMTTGTILIERALRTDGVEEAPVETRAVALNLVRNLALNPIIIAVVLATIWRVTSLPFGGLPETLINQLGGVAAPLALFAMGMALRQYGLGGNIGPAVALSVVKLIIHPAIVLILTVFVFDVPPIWAKAATLAAACPTGINAYLVASKFKTGQALSSNAITLSTALGVGSISVWLLIIEMVVQ